LTVAGGELFFMQDDAEAPRPPKGALIDPPTPRITWSLGSVPASGGSVRVRIAPFLGLGLVSAGPTLYFERYGDLEAKGLWRLPAEDDAAAERIDQDLAEGLWRVSGANVTARASWYSARARTS
jgi:hypothetical protein